MEGCKLKYKFYIGVVSYAANFIAATWFAVLHYITHKVDIAKIKSVQLQGRSNLARALNTIHDWRGVVEMVGLINGLEVRGIVVLTKLEPSKSTETDKQEAMVVRDTPLEKAFYIAQKMTSLSREHLRELAAKPDKYYSVGIKVDS